MKKLIASISLCLCLSPLFAKYSEIGFFLGVSSYTGDLHPNFFDFKIQLFHPAVGLLYRYNVNKHIAWRANAYYGKISGDDVLSTDAYSVSRNLSFQSIIIEASGQIEFNFLPYKLNDDEYAFSPYLFTGLAVFYFNPKTQYNGRVYPLPSLETEGTKYSLFQFAVPMGMGLKFNVGTMSLGIEGGARKTFTDYLDDVSKIYLDKNILSTDAAALSNKSNNINVTGRQRGNSSDKDWYLFAGIILTFKLGSNKVECNESFQEKF